MLAWAVYTSFIGAALVLLLPGSNARAARVVTLLTAVLGLALGLAGAESGGFLHSASNITSLPTESASHWFY